MNWKEAKKLKVGAIVRESWNTSEKSDKAIVLVKEYEKGEKYEAILSLRKPERFILTLAWFGGKDPGPIYSSCRNGSVTRESSWNVMVVSHAE